MNFWFLFLSKMFVIACLVLSAWRHDVLAMIISIITLVILSLFIVYQPLAKEEK